MTINAFTRQTPILRRIMFNVDITDDTVLEFEESFSAMFNMTPPLPHGVTYLTGSTSALVTIQDEG